MRALFLITVILLAAAIIWLAVTHTETIHSRMILNKAVYLYNSRQQEQAIDQALALLKRRPDYLPALEAAVGWLTARNEFDRARSLAGQYATTATLSLRSRYQLAVCAYETGREDEAVALFRSLPRVGNVRDDFSTPLVVSYLALTAEEPVSARVALETASPPPTGDIFYHSLRGRTDYARGDFLEATAQLSRAVSLGDRNPRARLLLAVCQAFSGDPRAMAQILDALEAEGLDAYAPAGAEINAELERLAAIMRYISPSQSAAHRDRTINLRLARVDIDFRQGRTTEALTNLDSLIHEYPDHPGLPTRMALLYERRQQPARALEFFRREADRLLLAAYRVVILEGRGPEAEVAFWQQFFPQGMFVLDSSQMHPTAGAPASDRGWNLSASGAFSASFTISSPGRYLFAMIARGDAAGKIWPIVQVYLNDELVAEQYINTPVWDLFQFRCRLREGWHSIRIQYVNDNVAAGVEGDRNFYLDKVIIRSDPN